MKFEFSAGGVVLKKDTDNPKVLVAQHSGHHGWVFPKGIIDKVKGETKEEAALREVKEETGVEGKIVQTLEPITYWYNLEGEKIKKTVYYFLMEYVSGDIKDHDWEMEKVEWIEPENVYDKLTYSSDKKVWKVAREFIANSV